mmetsp:Transcript_49014/g.90836  ORF Transcript_49014/g.90836 Transcript_49014/m.90836 type:complete len:185 (+) Transcript_49014:1758-2312(+)
MVHHAPLLLLWRTHKTATLIPALATVSSLHGRHGLSAPKNAVSKRNIELATWCQSLPVEEQAAHLIRSSRKRETATSRPVLEAVRFRRGQTGLNALHLVEVDDRIALALLCPSLILAGIPALLSLALGRFKNATLTAALWTVHCLTGQPGLTAQKIVAAEHSFAAVPSLSKLSAMAHCVRLSLT